MKKLLFLVLFAFLCPVFAAVNINTATQAELETLQDDYLECWNGLERKFDGTPGIK